MDIDILDSGPPGLTRLAASGSGQPGRASPEVSEALPARADRQAAVARLYQEHSLGLVRLAHIMLGEKTAAEDVVQEAFVGLYRRWALLSDQAKALQYARSAVLNGCRSVLRQRARRGQPGAWPTAAAGVPSAEAAVLDSEDNRALLAALHRLPDRQREAVVLRYYLDMPAAEIAATMGISQGSVRSATSRALESLGRLLGESG
jgi:RNA polymerase sigma-70 factor (sigma-E family)